MADYVLSARVTGDASNFENAISKAQKKLAAFDGSFEKSSATLSKIGSSVASIGDKLTSKITKPAIGAATALAGVTLGKGWARLTQIDTARAKLKGLGHSGEEVTSIMTSATDAVTGTAFSLAAAATTAATAAAAGIPVGKKMTQYLTDVANAAAIAGTDMETMGSIFNKVATNGKATSEVMNQLADRGVPIFTWLAESTGKSMDEIREDLQKGKIDLATFQKAVEEHVGDAAQELGDKTLTGAIANVGSAISKIGAAFLGSADDSSTFAGKILPMIVDLKDNLNSLIPKVNEIGATFGDVFGGLVNYAKTGVLSLGGMSDPAKDILLRLQPILHTVKGLIQSFNGLGTDSKIALAKALLGAGPLLVIFGNATKTVGKFGTAASKAFSLASAGVSAVSKLAGGIASAFGGSAKGAFSVTGAMIKASLSTIAPTALFGALLVGLGLLQTQFGDQLNAIAQTAIEKGPEIITNLTNGIAQKIPELVAKGAELLTNFLNVVTANAPSLISGGIQIIASLVDGVTQSLPQLLPAGIQAVMSIVTGIFTNLPTLIASGASLIAGLVTGLLQNLPMIISTAGQAIVSFVQGLTQNLPNIVGNGINIIVSLITGIITGLPQILAQGWEIIKALAQGIWEAIPGILQGAVDGIKGLFTNLWDLITGKSSESSQEMADDMASAATSVTESANSMASGVATASYELSAEGTAGFEELMANAQSMMASTEATTVGTAESMALGVNGAISGMGGDSMSTTEQMTAQMSASVEQCQQKFTNSFNQIKETTTSAMNAVVNTCKNASNAMQAAFANLPAALQATGANAGQGLLNGLSSKEGAILAKSRSIASKVASTMNDALAVGSPSKKTTWTGRMTGLGYLNGLDYYEDQIYAKGEEIALAAYQPDMTQAYTTNYNYQADTSSIEEAIRTGMNGSGGSLERALVTALENLSISVDGRTFGRTVRKYA